MTEECLKILREQLLKTAEEKHWTIQRLANECGICTRTIANIFSGEHPDIHLSVVVRISKGLGIPIACLVSKEEMKKYDDAMFLKKLLAEINTYVKKGNTAV